MTLPGLESVDADRSAITLADHVDAICAAVTAAGRPSCSPCTAAPACRLCRHGPHPGADRGDGLRRHRPGEGRARPRLRPRRGAAPTSEELAAAENLDGLTEEHLETFRRRAVPPAGRRLREAAELTNDARLDVPSTVICTGYTSQYKDAVEGGLGLARRPGRAARRDLRRPADEPLADVVAPEELAAILGDVAKAESGG